MLPTHIIDMNAYMLILFNKLTEISQTSEFPENSGKIYIPEYLSEMSKQESCKISGWVLP